METIHPLQQERERRGWSRAHLAALLHTSEISIFRWEHGQVTPQSYHRAKLVEIYGKSSLELGIDPRPLSSPPVVATSPTLTPSACYDPLIPLVSTTRVIGRDQDVADVRQRLCSNRTIVLTALQGLPGVGKTTLAAYLAHDQEVRASFRDGILWAGLGPEPPVSGILRRWGRLLGLSTSEMESFQDRRAWETALRTVIGERRFLLVIDDVWKIDDILPLLVGGARCAHLVTTRFPTLANHLVPDGATVIQELDAEQSFLLLEALAPKAMAYEPQKAHALIELLGGLPLALTLIGNYLRKQSYNEHPRRIRMALESLHDLHARLHLSELPLSSQHYPSLFPEGVLSLHAVIALSDHLLENDTRVVLYALSVFPAKPQSFSEEAACQVTQCSVETLDTLVDAGLLESVGADRYTLHQTIADYARAHLQDHAPLQQMIDYGLTFLRAHTQNYEAQAQESPIIEAALEAAFTRDMREAMVQLVSAFTPFLIARGEYRLALHYVQQAYEAATTLHDEQSCIDMIYFQGKLAQKLGNLKEAATSYQEGLRRARQLEDQERICTLLIDSGWLVWRYGEYTQAHAHVQEGLRLARQLELRKQICYALNISSILSMSRGFYKEAENDAREGLALARLLGDSEQQMYLLINLGIALAERGALAEGHAIFEEALVLARQVGDWVWTGTLLLNLGQIASLEERFDEAEHYYREGLPLAHKTGQREWIAILHLNLGEMEIKRGRLDGADAHLHVSLQEVTQMGHKRLLAEVLYLLGTLALARGAPAEAKPQFQKMISVLPEKDQEIEAQSQYGLARVAHAQGRVEEARISAERSLHIFEAIGLRTAQDVRAWMQKSLQAQQAE